MGSPLALSEGAGAPETEIEITPEMIKAGVCALVAFNPDFESDRDAAVRIYLAMREHQRSEGTERLVGGTDFCSHSQMRVTCPQCGGRDG